MSGRRPYSDDVRALMISEFEAGASRREAGRHVRVSPATAVRWVKQVELTGRVERRPAGGRSRSPLEPQSAWLLALVGREPDLTLEQIAERLAAELAVKTTKSSIDRFFGRHGISFKKNTAGGRTGAAGRGRRAHGLEGRSAKP
jgi:transposase